MLSYQDNAATMEDLLTTHYVFNGILFDYLNAYHQISPEQDIECALKC